MFSNGHPAIKDTEAMTSFSQYLRYVKASTSESEDAFHFLTHRERRVGEVARTHIVRPRCLICM